MAQESSVKSCTWNRSKSRHRCLRIVSGSCTTRSSGCRNRSELLRSILSSLIRWSIDAMRTNLWWSGTRWTCSSKRTTSARSTMKGEMPTFKASDRTKTVWWRTILACARIWKHRARILPTRASPPNIRIRSKRCTKPLILWILAKIAPITKTWTDRITIIV